MDWKKLEPKATLLIAIFIISALSASNFLAKPTNLSAEALVTECTTCPEEEPTICKGENLSKVAGVRYRSFGNTGGNEVYLGEEDLGVGGNRVEQGVTWVAGTYDVTFAWNPATKKITTLVLDPSGGTVANLEYTLCCPGKTPGACWDSLLITVHIKDRPVEYIIELITEILGIKYKIEGDKIYLDPIDE